MSKPNLKEIRERLADSDPASRKDTLDLLAYVDHLEERLRTAEEAINEAVMAGLETIIKWRKEREEYDKDGS